jgi:mediator of RNA polymerase II transcription subunit 12
LLGKKNCVDLSGGDPNAKAKKKKEKDGGDPVSNLDNTFGKFRKLSYYDQHAVTQTVAKLLSETISSFASGTVSYLPQIDYVSFLFDLMEYCLNISRLLDLAIQVRLL